MMRGRENALGQTLAAGGSGKASRSDRDAIGSDALGLGVEFGASDDAGSASPAPDVFLSPTQVRHQQGARLAPSPAHSDARSPAPHFTTSR